MDKVPSWMEKLLLPKLNEITGEIKAIHTRIDAVEKEIVSLRNEMVAKFEVVDVKIGSLRNEMISRFKAVDARFNALEVRIPARVELEEFEIRLLVVEKKLATV